MKKWFIILLTLVAFSSPIILGGCSMLNGKSEKEEMIEIAESWKAKKTIEQLLKQEDPKALTEEGIIKKYSIDQKKLRYNPMGGLIIYIIVNDDQDLTITTTLLEEENGKLEHTGYVISEELAKKLRGE